MRMASANKRIQGFLEKWLIPWVGQGKYKVILEHIVSEHKEIKTIGACQKGTRVNLKVLPMAKSRTI